LEREMGWGWRQFRGRRWVWGGRLNWSGPFYRPGDHLHDVFCVTLPLRRTKSRDVYYIQFNEYRHKFRRLLHSPFAYDAQSDHLGHLSRHT